MQQFVAVVAVLLSMAGFAWADTKGDPFDRLVKSNALKCVFHLGSYADWKNGKVKLEQTNEVMTTIFDSIDLPGGKARGIGDNLATDVSVHRTGSGLTFIEVTGIGNHVVTTVFRAYKSGSQEFIAVTSRHMVFLMGPPLPSQYHGTCQDFGK